MAVVDIASKLDSTSCCVCGIEFAVPLWWLKKRREERLEFYCPNGHSLSLNDTLRANLARAEAKRAEAEAFRVAAERARDEAQRQAKAARTRAKKERERCAASLCPVPGCHRSFATERLRRHLATKHPHWKPGPEAVDDRHDPLP